jgi:sugar lactone lactonase YvrE
MRSALLGVLIFVIATAQTRANLTLTPDGVAQGLSLSTFLTGIPTDGGIGPLGIAVNSNGTVLVADLPGNVRLLPNDSDGQVATPAQVAQNYGFANATALAQVGSHVYMTRQNVSTVVEINQNGTLNQLITTGVSVATGMVANPFTGHLYVSTLAIGEIWDVNPVTKTKTLFNNGSADGLSLSLDGSVLYGVSRDNLTLGHILGWNTSNGAQVFDSGFIPGSPDGLALGTGAFAGLVFANTNDGHVVEVNLNTLVQTTIAEGGSRGDFVTVDPLSDTLLLTQTDSIVRLHGATFTTPEPSSLMIALGALTLIAGMRVFSRRTRD